MQQTVNLRSQVQLLEEPPKAMAIGLCILLRLRILKIAHIAPSFNGKTPVSKTVIPFAGVIRVRVPAGLP